ncbi:MAG TPA: OmpA family protein, partial [Candidatus Saccharimonadales bacterium]|nr:OmpA family protein [Candidatus Saccharimonadales bacterium]
EQAQTAQQQAQQARQQEEQTREQLKQQLNSVLQTRETARGLIVNMSDVLFAFNKYNLKPDAQVKLAKVSGILLAHPDLKVQVEGYTDNIGSDQYNQKLSQERADAVRDFLVSQDVPQQEVTAQGFGESHPVADNSSAAGRQQNRRVELVVSGQSIGIQQAEPGQTGENAQPAAPGNNVPNQNAPIGQNPQGAQNGQGTPISQEGQGTPSSQNPQGTSNPPSSTVTSTAPPQR